MALAFRLLFSSIVLQHPGMMAYGLSGRGCSSSRRVNRRSNAWVMRIVLAALAKASSLLQ
jgi:hypothetical protein